MVCQEYQELMSTLLENEKSNVPAFEVSDMGGAHLFERVMLHIPDYYYVRYLERQSFFL